jgi:hypothetical protein
MGFTFSWWWFERKTIRGFPAAFWRPAGIREMPFSRSNSRRRDMGLPWHKARDYLASGWRRTTSLCQKNNCKRKAHAHPFLGNSRDRTLCWLPRDSTLDSPFFLWRSDKSTPSENAVKSQKTRKPLSLIHMDNASVHTARAAQEKLNVSRFKRTRHPPYGPDIAPSDFFFSVVWKSSLNEKNIMGKMNYRKSWMKFWHVFLLKWSKRSLSTGWIDSNAWLMEMVTTFPKISQMNLWTELSNGKHVRIEL